MTGRRADETVSSSHDDDGGRESSSPLGRSHTHTHTTTNTTTIPQNCYFFFVLFLFSSCNELESIIAQTHDSLYPNDAEMKKKERRRAAPTRVDDPLATGATPGGRPKSNYGKERERDERGWLSRVCVCVTPSGPPFVLASRSQRQLVNIMEAQTISIDGQARPSVLVTADPYRRWEERKRAQWVTAAVCWADNSARCVNLPGQNETKISRPVGFWRRLRQCRRREQRKIPAECFPFFQLRLRRHSCRE